MKFYILQTTLLEETVMKKDNIESLSGQTLFVGIDVYKKSFHVTFRTFDCEMSSQLIPS